MLSKLRICRKFASFDYDLAVIGSGPGGYVAAIKAAQLGLNTACIEKRATLGGTCLNVGCIPAKSLANSTHKYAEACKDFQKHGIIVENPRFDLSQMMKAKQKAVDGLTKGIGSLFKKNKVTHVPGTATFKGANEIEVDGKKLTAKNFIIATGSEPANLPGGILPIDENRVLSSTGAMQLAEVPKKLLVIGGGVIGLELGSVWSRLGSEVIFVEFFNRIAAGNDLEVAQALQKILEKQGMKFYLSTKVVGGESTSNGVKLNLEGTNSPTTLEGDYALVSVGRRPNTIGLNLEGLGITKDKQGRIEVNDQLQTAVKNIYAIGDVIKGPMLAHKAEEEGIFVAENLGGGKGHINYEAIPGVIYTHPEVAMVGKTEENLKEMNVEYNKGTFPFMANSRARANNETEGFVKVLADKKTDRILGIHIIGPTAGELIMEGVIGMEYKAASEDLARTTHAHPGFCEAIKEACLAAFSKPIHF
ncbi:unnamed protein product [Blepharisma stoltei]|uniref:Dihydrolipoyl dehydrogenase n=1 Tax=Blepharisma stoltei TaxID=1481888 RepID=A0AAU9ISZ4_9CILI|nr:unnamed protein product [Blepharisma stoltei]